MLCEQEKRRFLTSLHEGTLFHSYIVEAASPDAAEAFLSYCRDVMLCGSENKPCGVCADCKKLAADSHPDVTVCGGDGKPANMEAVRSVIALSHIPPGEGGCRVFIFKNCEKMRWDAQNALLKLLEEPPPYVRLLLSTAKKEAMLPTVRSRCRLITLSDDAPISHDKQTVAARERAVKTVGMLCGGCKRFDFFSFMTEKMTRDKALLYLSELYTVLTDTVCGRNTDGDFGTLGRRSACAMADAVTAARAAAEANANLSSLFAALAIRLWELK